MIKRKKNRLKNFDYSGNGAYFITICVKDRKKILCDIVGADTIRPCEIMLSKYGKIVEEAINNISSVYENVTVSEYVIMPDHIHIILQIDNNNGRMVSAPTVVAGMKRYVSKNAVFPFGKNHITTISSVISKITTKYGNILKTTRKNGY